MGKRKNACVCQGLRTGKSTGRSLRSLTLTTIHYYRESTCVQVTNLCVVKPENMRQSQEPHLHGRRQADEDEAEGAQYDRYVSTSKRERGGRAGFRIACTCAKQVPC